MFLFCSTQHPVPPRSEASSGDIQRAEAGAAPVGGLVTRTRATAGHYDPDDVGAAAVERRKASAPIARGTGTSRKRPSACLAHTPKCGLSHGRTSAFPALRSLFGGRRRKRRRPVRQRVEKSTPGSAQRWLFDKVKKDLRSPHGAKRNAGTAYPRITSGVGWATARFTAFTTYQGIGAPLPTMRPHSTMVGKFAVAR